MKRLTKRLPKPGDIVELIYTVTVWTRGTDGSHVRNFVRFPKGKTGLVTECDGLASWVLIDGQEYDIVDNDLEVIGEALE
jgi:hypothetical protein